MHKPIYRDPKSRLEINLEQIEFRFREAGYTGEIRLDVDVWSQRPRLLIGTDSAQSSFDLGAEPGSERTRQYCEFLYEIVHNCRFNGEVDAWLLQDAETHLTVRCSSDLQTLREVVALAIAYCKE